MVTGSLERVAPEANGRTNVDPNGTHGGHGRHAVSVNPNWMSNAGRGFGQRYRNLRHGKVIMINFDSDGVNGALFIPVKFKGKIKLRKAIDGER